MTVFDPRIDRHLIADQGEVVIDEVRKHWAAIVGAVLELLGAFAIVLLSFFVPPRAWWVPALVGAAVALHASWRILEQHVDRFVITSMRVFRVHGILSQRIATMPLSRILDISVHKPLVGRVIGYGHFVFESAAQEQGLREIRFVGDPDERGLTIQRVIQQAGLRGFVAHNPNEAVPHAMRARQVVESTADAAADAPVGWEWIALARAREEKRLAELRGERDSETVSFDPDRTVTAPIDLPG